VTTNTTGLSAGTYNGTITLNSTGATNTPQTVPVTLTIGCTKPGAPTLSSPANGASISGTSATFAWAAGTGTPTKYWLQVNSNSSFTGTNYHSVDVGNVTSKSVTTLPNNGSTLYWRVQAYNAAGWGPWSSVRNFINGAVPAAPTLSSPANGAKVSATSYTFTWAAGTGSPTKYQLQVNSNSSFTGTSYFSAQVTTTSRLVTSLPNKGATLYWRVRAYNAAGWGAWSSVRNFYNGP
jgi:hypothetical protein